MGFRRTYEDAFFVNNLIYHKKCNYIFFLKRLVSNIFAKYWIPFFAISPAKFKYQNAHFWRHFEMKTIELILNYVLL